MKVERTSKITICLTGEETALLQNTLALLQNVNREVNNPNIDEADFEDERDKELIQEMFNELDEICYVF